MPRKGRLVQPRHIFPWIAAPYIEMLRILWRIEGFFLLPIKYLKAWTVSAIFGVLGVFFSIALFIPRLTETQVQASPDPKLRFTISPYDLPALPNDQEVLPTGSGKSLLDIRFRRLAFTEPFDQNAWFTTKSHPVRRSIPAHMWSNDPWRQYRQLASRSHELPLDSYIMAARVWRELDAPLPVEYIYDARTSGTRDLTTKAPTLLIQKSVPKGQSPQEPLISLITVTNNGNEPVESAIVTEEVSDITRVIDCQPPAMRSANSKQLVWNLSELLPQETRELRITIQPAGLHYIAQTTEVAFSSAPVIAETMVRERPAAPVAPTEPEITPQPVQRPKTVGKPKLVVQFDPPRTVKVGEEVEAFYTITNVGTADSTGIRLLVEVPQNLRHRFGDLVEHKISRLAPNESRRALFAALAESAGRMPLNWTLEANDLPNQSNSEWLAIAAAPAPVITTPITSTPTPAKSSIPAGRSTVPANSGIVPPEKSSIPRNGSVPLEEPTLATPTDSPGLENLPPETLPGGDTSPNLSPALSSDVPAAAFGPRPLTEPSSLPSWVKPEIGQDPITPTDPMSSMPIEPELTSEPESELDSPILQPGETGGLGEFGIEPPAAPSSIPSGERTDGVKAQ